MNKTGSGKNSHGLSRRDFLKAGVSGAGVLAFPTILPSSVFGASAPSNRIALGCIGTGNQGTLDLKEALQNEDVQIVAVCDVNRGSFGYKDSKQFCGREPAQKIVQEHYAAKVRSGAYSGCDTTNDFRELLSRQDIDAVLIVTPDHWHAAMTILAAQVGKDIYCEKPLSLTIADGRAMVEAVQRCGVILQTGTQRRSSDLVRRACELVRNGRIGEVKRVIAHVAANNKKGPDKDWKPEPVPEGFDYDLWLGPAPYAPYHSQRCFYTFRFILDYSGGQTTNFGAHSNDVAQWGLGMDESGPVELEDNGSEIPSDGLFNTPTKVNFRAWYASGAELICKTAEPSSSVRFEGTEGWIDVDVDHLTSEPRSIQKSVIGPDEIHLYESKSHMRNFLDCVKSRKTPAAPAETGHRSASVCHLGNIAMLLKRRLTWDPVAERFVGDEEANRMLSRPLRQPWRL